MVWGSFFLLFQRKCLTWEKKCAVALATDWLLVRLDYLPKKNKKADPIKFYELSFRELKYTIGVLDFHSKKVMCIQQEIYAERFIIASFTE